MFSFGTFTITPKYDPTLLMSNDLASRFNLRQRAQTGDNIPTGMLNLSQVAGNTKIPRDVVDKIYSKFIACLGKAIVEGRKIVITVHRVSMNIYIYIRAHCTTLCTLCTLYTLYTLYHTIHTIPHHIHYTSPHTLYHTIPH